MSYEDTLGDGTAASDTPEQDLNEDAAYEKRYKDAQAYATKLAQEKKELEAKLAAAQSPESLNPLKEELRTELQQELARRDELNNFLSNRAELADKVEALQGLQESVYKGKTLNEIADILYGAGPDTQAANNRVTREVALGEASKTSGKTLEEMTPEEIKGLSDAEFLELRQYSDGLSKRR